jgi:hypothetical protein
LSRSQHYIWRDVGANTEPNEIALNVGDSIVQLERSIHQITQSLEHHLS